jgi:hypothetical protein
LQQSDGRVVSEERLLSRKELSFVIFVKGGISELYRTEDTEAARGIMFPAVSVTQPMFFILVEAVSTPSCLLVSPTQDDRRIALQRKLK